MAYSAIPLVGGGGGGDGRRILNTWNVPAGHPFVAGSVVIYTGGATGFQLAIADDLDTAQTVGIVESVTSTTATVIYQGEIDFVGSLPIDDTATSLTAGTVYYLSPTNLGNLSPNRPYDGASYIQGVLVATAAKSGFVINSLPQAPTTASLFTPVGSIIPWAGSFNTVPETWRICDGAAVRKSGNNPIDNVNYSTLYSIINDKYKVTGIATSTTGPIGNPSRDVIISFSAEGHEDYAGTTSHGLLSAYNSDTHKDYKIGWGGTNDVAIGSLTAANSSTVRFQFKSTYPGATPVNFTGVSVSSLISIQSLTANEAVGCTSDRFFIPDLRARTVFGVGYSSGLTDLKRGEIGGDDTHLLASDEIPDHDNTIYSADTFVEGGSNVLAFNTPVNTNITNATARLASFTADNDPISMMPPYLGVNWIIRHKQFQGPGIEIGPPGSQGGLGNTGCGIYLVSNTKTNGCYAVVFGYTGANCSGATFGTTACDGVDGEDGGVGPAGPAGGEGPAGPAGGEGPAGPACQCDAFGNIVPAYTIYTAPTSSYKDGIVGNPNESFLSTKLSMDSLYPTDFAYMMNTFQATNLAPESKAPFYYRDPANSVNEYTFAYGKPLTTPTNPNQEISHSSVFNLSVINDSASSFASPFDIVLTNGVYTLTKPWHNYISRDLYIRAENNSVVTQTVKGITFLPVYTPLGATSGTQFNLQVNIGTGQSMLAATGCGIRFLPPLSIVSGVTSSNGVSSAFDGITSGTGGVMNMLIGGHEVVGISGQYFSLKVNNEGGQAFTNLLNKTFTNYINAVDIYRVTVHTTSPSGALFTTRNTNTFVGDWTVGGVASDGIAFINHSTTASLNDISMTPYISGGSYGNTVALQTDGGTIKARGCMFLDYPVAAHAYNGGTIRLGHCSVSGSYYGFAADSGANADVAGSIFSRCSFPIITEGAGSLSISHDLTNIGKTHIKGNRSPISIANTSAVIGSTDIIGPGILATNSNVKIRPFTRILSDTGFSKGTDVGVVNSTELNKFAILAINSNIDTPDMAGSISMSANDVVTSIPTAKFQGTGRIQALNSKFTLSYTNTAFSPMTDAAGLSDTFRGDTQLPINS